MANAWGDIYTAMKRGSTPKNTYMPNLTGSITGPTSPSGVGAGPLGSTPKPKYKAPGVQPQQQQPQQQRVQQQRVQQQGGAFNFKPFDWQGIMNQFQLPGMPQASQQQIADWLARAKTEAGLQFDPQLMGIRQALESALLGSQEARGGIDPAYEGAVRNINDWLERNLGAEDRRWYARGMGRGGGARMAQAEITGKAGQGIADIEQERARVITDIEKQESLLKKQAGEKEAGVATARGQFISSRSAGLRENWEAQKAQLDQQAFSNQMQIAQFGLTAESERFGQQIQMAQFNADQAYRDQLVALQKDTPTGEGLDPAPTNRPGTAVGGVPTGGATDFMFGSPTPFGINAVPSSNVWGNVPVGSTTGEAWRNKAEKDMTIEELNRIINQ